MDIENTLPEPFKDVPERQDYVGIPLKTMRTDAVLETQLYIKIGPNRFVKYREANLGFDEEVRRRLCENQSRFHRLQGD